LLQGAAIAALVVAMVVVAFDGGIGSFASVLMAAISAAFAAYLLTQRPAGYGESRGQRALVMTTLVVSLLVLAALVVLIAKGGR